MGNKIMNIGLSGVARSGKNSFADIMIDIYKERGIMAKQFSLAWYLKKDCEKFIQEKLDLCVWSEKTEEKSVFRPLLIWYGDVMRKRTTGKYWTDMLQKDLEKSDAQINIVTDIRYSVYPEDEVHWIKHAMNGKLIHIAKYELKGSTKVFTEPDNDHELYNDPIVKKNADVVVQWPAFNINGNGSYMAMLKDDNLRGIVGGAIDKL